MSFGGQTQSWLRKHCLPMGNFYMVVSPVPKIIFGVEMQHNSPTAATGVLTRKLAAWQVSWKPFLLLLRSSAQTGSDELPGKEPVLWERTHLWLHTDPKSYASHVRSLEQLKWINLHLLNFFSHHCGFVFFVLTGHSRAFQQQLKSFDQWKAVRANKETHLDGELQWSEAGNTTAWSGESPSGCPGCSAPAVLGAQLQQRWALS